MNNAFCVVSPSSNPNCCTDPVAATFAGALTVSGNTILGSNGGGQTLTVYASATFSAGLTTIAATVTGAFTAQGNTGIGVNNTQTLTVNAASTFNAASIFNAAVAASSDVTIALAGTLTARGNVVLGSLGNSRSLTVSAATTIFNPSEAGASVTIAGTSSFFANNNAAIGTSRSNSLTVNSDSNFNGAVTGFVGIQVRAVPVILLGSTPAAAPVIPNTVSFVDATANTGSSNILRLPIPIMGLHIRIAAGSTRFLLQSFGTGYLINGDTSGATSHTVFPNQLVDCVAVSATTFYCSVTGPSWICPANAACIYAGGFAIAQNFPN